MGTVLTVLGVLAVLAVAALVATRDGELLVDAPRDRADLDLPADGPVRADDLDRVRFGMALRGYRMAEVDALLDRLGLELRDRDVRLAELEDRAGPGGAGDVEPEGVGGPGEVREPPDGAAVLPPESSGSRGGAHPPLQS